MKLKRMIISILVILLVCNFSAFSSGQDETSEVEKEEISNQTDFVVVGHQVHQRVTSQGAGGDITAEWAESAGVENIEWMTMGVMEISERLFREASLSSTTVDVGFLTNKNLSPDIVNLFMPLDELLEEFPIEDYEDIFPGMREAVTIDGKVYGIPFRHATSSLLYNKEYFRQQGIEGPPETIEQLIEMIPQLTFEAEDGTQVYGFGIPGKDQNYDNHVDLASAWGGGILTPDYELIVNDSGMVKAVSTIASLYKEGNYPAAFTTLARPDIDTWMQQGRLAMTFGATGRYNLYNNPESSKFPGQIGIAPIPASKDFLDRFPIAPAKVEFWVLVIPKNARNPKLSWDFIRYLSQKEETLRSALNGNGPVRNSIYDDPEFQNKVPYWQVEQEILNVARVPMPAFDGSSQAADIFLEYSTAAELGIMSVQEAMDIVADQIQKLLPIK